MAEHGAEFREETASVGLLIKRLGATVGIQANCDLGHTQSHLRTHTRTHTESARVIKLASTANFTIKCQPWHRVGAESQCDSFCTNFPHRGMSDPTDAFTVCHKTCLH